MTKRKLLDEAWEIYRRKLMEIGQDPEQIEQARIWHRAGAISLYQILVVAAAAAIKGAEGYESTPATIRRVRSEVEAFDRKCHDD